MLLLLLLLCSRAQRSSMESAAAFRQASGARYWGSQRCARDGGAVVSGTCHPRGLACALQSRCAERCCSPKITPTHVTRSIQLQATLLAAAPLVLPTRAPPALLAPAQTCEGLCGRLPTSHSRCCSRARGWSAACPAVLTDSFSLYPPAGHRCLARRHPAICTVQQHVAAPPLRIPPCPQLAFMAGAATILQQPDAVAATPSGEVIVADVGDRRLQVCQRQPAGCCSALHACSDGAGSCDQAKGPRSSLFHPVCPLLQQPNNQPTSHPTDPWLQVFSAVDGAFLRTLGGPMLFFRIRGLGVHHATGCIYVADALMNRVVVLSPEGEVVAHFGHRGSGDGDLERCAGLCVRVQSVCKDVAGLAGAGQVCALWRPQCRRRAARRAGWRARAAWRLHAHAGPRLDTVGQGACI